MWRRLAVGALFAGVALGFSARPASAGPPSPRSAGSWRSFVSETGRFQVELPADPLEEPDEEHFTLLGPVTGEKYTLRSGDLVLAVEVRDIPALARTLVPTDSILEKTREGVIDDMGAVEVQERHVTLGGLPARDFVYRIPGQPPVFERALAVLVGRRLYLVTGQAAGRPGSSPELEHFFGSFRFWSEGRGAPRAGSAAERDARASDPPATGAVDGR